MFIPSPATARRGFFVAGGALTIGAPSYVDRAADGELLDALLAGELCYVLTSRQMGKSSLMVRTAARLREAGVRVALLDITAQGQNVTPEQWFRGLLEAVGEALGLETELISAWRDLASLAPARRWLAALERVVLPGLASHPEGLPSLVLCFDEIDAVRSLPFSSDELFLLIRHCTERAGADASWRRVTFCLLGVASPAELVRSPEVTPFNLGRRIELAAFVPSEAAPLAAGLHKPDRDPKAARLALSRVLHWTNGHPYLTQRLCEALAARSGGNGLKPSLVDHVCASLFFSGSDRPQDSNLLFVRDLLLQAPGAEAASPASVELLHLYDRILAGKPVADNEANALVERLRLAGLVKSERGRLVPSNRIYQRVFDRKWVQRHLPGEELRRQQAAYRRGVRRTLLLSGVLTTAFAAIALVALWNQWQLEESVRENREARKKIASDARELDIRLNRALKSEGAQQTEKRRAQSLERLARGALVAQKRLTAERDRALKRALSSERQANYRLRQARLQELERHLWGGIPAQALGTLDLLLSDAPTPEEATAYRTARASLSERMAKQRWFRRIEPRVKSIIPSPRADQALLVLDDGTAEQIDVHSGKPLGPRLRQSAEEGSGGIMNAAYSSDGRFFVTLGARAVLRDAAAGKPLRTSKSPIQSQALFVSGDKQLVAPGNAGELRTWHTESLQPAGALFRAAASAPVWGLAPSGDEEWCLALDSETYLRRYNWKTGQQAQDFERDEVYWMAADPRRRRLAVFQRDGALLLLDARTGATRASLGHLRADRYPNTGAVRLQFQPAAGDLLVFRADGCVRAWHGDSGEPLSALTYSPSSLRTASLIGDGSVFVGATPDGDVGAWKLAPPNGRQRLVASHPRLNRAVSLSGQLIAFCKGDRTIQFRSNLDGQLAAPLHGDSVQTPMALSDNGRWLLTSQSGRDWSLYDRINRLWLARQVDVRDGPLFQVAFTHDGSHFLLVAAGSQTLYRVNPSSPPTRLKSYSLPRGNPLSLVGGGNHLMLAGPDEYRLWQCDPASWTSQAGSDVEVKEVSISADGSVLALCRPGGVEILASATRAPLTEARFLRGASLHGCALSADGTALATMAENEVRVWSIPSGKLQCEFRLPSIVRSVAFDPSGRRVAALDAEGCIALWDTLVRAPLSAPLWTSPGGGKLVFPAFNRLVALNPMSIAAFNLP